MLFIGLVQAFEDGASNFIEDEVSNVIEEGTEAFSTSTWLDLHSEDVVDLSDRNLGSCRVCKKKYLGNVNCGHRYKNPEMHRDYVWSSGECLYSCCTNIWEDPKCCTSKCDFTCNGKYVLNGDCKKGYKRATKERWGSFEIGPHGPYGYRVATKRFYKNPRCYHGCCSDDLDGTGCCVKA